jgi:hypothetical protein
MGSIQMKLTFKQFLKESGQNSFEGVKDMIELIDDSITLDQASGPYMFFRFPKDMDGNKKEAIVNKIKQHTDDKVYVLFKICAVKFLIFKKTLLK